jgi:hypothetical protein
MRKAGLYALGFTILIGVLILGAGFVLWDAVVQAQAQAQPAPALAA